MSNMIEDGERHLKLAEMALVEAPLDPLLEHICALARSIFDVPMAFVSVIDLSLGHIIAEDGIGRGRLPREDAICDLTIRDDAPLVIPDTLADARVSGGPLVVGGPRFRFYAGIPLVVSPGFRVGALCVTDTRPREVTPAQIDALRSLAEIVVGQFRSHVDRLALARQALDIDRKQTILSQSERFAKVGGFEADPADGSMIWSDELYRLYGIDRAVQPTFEHFFALANGPLRAFRAGFAGLRDSGDEMNHETSFTDGAGTLRHVRVHAKMQAGAGGTGKIVGIVQDITERKSAMAELQWIATHDSLTKLCNRQTFNDLIERAVEDADHFGQRVALIMLDIDQFKTINDSLGHDAGDAVLVAVAERLVEATGRRGVVARVGGDEFAVLVTRFETDGVVAALATDVLGRLRQPLVFRGAELGTRASLGVAVMASGTTNAAALFKNADIALYTAKQAGRDGIAFYRSSMREKLESRIQRLADARVAVSNDRIEPYYQPKICLETGAVLGFEALLRWHHPLRGLCAPGEMSDAFADNELSVAIGRGMLRRVVADLVEWRARGLDAGQIAINVAEPEFHGGDYAERLLACLAAHDLTPDRIEVEITESVFLGQQSGKVATTLGKLADGGVSIALDDFGTGYASLTHLKQYPVGSIKIDRSFVMDIETSASAATIVDALTSLANSLKIGVVAEGIETHAQLAFLRARRCAVGQGYLFAKPMAASRVPHFLKTWTMPRATTPRLAARG